MAQKLSLLSLLIGILLTSSVAAAASSSSEEELEECTFVANVSGTKHANKIAAMLGTHMMNHVDTNDSGRCKAIAVVKNEPVRAYNIEPKNRR